MILPGDILWSRFRVARVESERFDCAWLRSLNAPNSIEGTPPAPTHVLISLHPPAQSPLAEMLAALWPGASPSQAWLSSVSADPASASVTETRARLPLLGEVEWRGAPNSNGLVLLAVHTATPLEQFFRQRPKPPAAAHAINLIADFAEALERLLTAAGHSKERFCRAAVKLLNPRSTGISRDGARLEFTPQLDVRPPQLTPPDWAFFAAPEMVAAGIASEAALVFGVARVAMALLFDSHGVEAKAAELLPYGWQRLAVSDIAFREFKRDPRAAALPKDLRALLAKCLRPKPSGRFATLAKFRAALAKLRRAIAQDSPTPVSDQQAVQHALALRPPAADGMVLIEAGPYISGEKKLSRTLRGYFIDATPVTEKNYRDFLNEIGRQPLDGGPGSRGSKYDKHPVVNVTWREAEEFATHYGKRLPTIYEWEKAARGKDGRKYPYGNEYAPNTGKLRAISPNGPPGKETTKETQSTGSFPRGASPFGVLDMAGNVLEWTSTARRQGDRIFRAAKGACFLDGSVELSRCTSIQFKKPDVRENFVGFRCVKDLE